MLVDMEDGPITTNKSLPFGLYSKWWNLEYVAGDHLDMEYLKDEVWAWFTKSCKKLDKEYHPDA